MKVRCEENINDLLQVKALMINVNMLALEQSLELLESSKLLQVLNYICQYIEMHD